MLSAPCQIRCLTCIAFVLQAKLGNSTVSPNIGHLVLKYLCPAMKDILHDGLKAYILNVIIGQRKNLPWTVIEASTQLGMTCHFSIDWKSLNAFISQLLLSVNTRKKNQFSLS